MTDRKKSGKTFHNPFKQLKGLSVSARSEQKAAGKTPDVPPSSAPAEEEEDLFAREMARLGVEGRGEERAAADAEEAALPQEATPAAPESEEELFLASLGEMEVTFRDQQPSEAEPRAAARRMKQLRQGRLAPEATLDLHGFTREEAREKVRYFLEDAVYQGRKTVLIVTGRGIGSQGEPVLRSEIERYLSGAARTWVVEWGRAPRRLGGEGALVVFLKQGGKKS